MTGPRRRDIANKLRELEDDVEHRDAPDIVIKDTVVSTPWSADRDDREVPPDSVTRLKWVGGEFVEVE